jgi:arylsulfatase A-like enzyme
VVVLGSVFASSLDAAPAKRPHIVLITVDDLGWKDVGYHGGTIHTPHLDRLAKDAARLEQFYVQPFSTQTRAALLTGRYPMRYGLQTLQVQAQSRFGLPAEERTLPEALKEAGYRTALVGKWHLGHAKRAFLPNQQGFDYFYGHLTGEIDYFKKTSRTGDLDWWRNGKRMKQEGYATTLLAREASALIARHDPSTPLFLHVSFCAPQAPHQAPTELLDLYRDVPDLGSRTYRAMISAVDAGVGSVLAALEQRAMLGNTLIVFLSTTGGAVRTKFPAGDGDTAHTVASNGPFRDGRGSLHEGGLRSAAFVWWPGQVQAGAITELMHATDLYPVLLGVAGAPREQAKPLDGIDAWPVIAEGMPTPRKEVLLNVEDSRGAIRVGDWKLVAYAMLPSRVELYNLRADPSEEDNQAEREAERVQALLKRLNDYAWEMEPSAYLADLMSPHQSEIPFFWGDNPPRP